MESTAWKACFELPIEQDHCEPVKADQEDSLLHVSIISVPSFGGACPELWPKMESDAQDKEVNLHRLIWLIFNLGNGYLKLPEWLSPNNDFGILVKRLEQRQLSKYEFSEYEESIKRTRDGKDSAKTMFEDGRKAGREEAERDGRKAGREETIKAMFEAAGCTLQMYDIAKTTHLDLDIESILGPREKYE